MPIIRLVVGDYSGDGHNKSESFYINSSLSKKNMQEAYINGAKKLGVDLVNDICTNYEDSRLPPEAKKIFMDAGFEDKYDYELDDEESMAYNHQWFDLYLFTVWYGNNDFEYLMENQNAETIIVGGYGLF